MAADVELQDATSPPPCAVQAQDDLSQEASAVSEISLNHAVRQAISASNAKYDDDDIVDRVRARKNKAFGGESGKVTGILFCEDLL